MKTALYVSLLMSSLFLGACSKQDVGTPAQSAATTPDSVDSKERTSLKLKAENGGITVSAKPGMDQTAALSLATDKDGRRPQPTTINGLPATAQLADGVASTASIKVAPQSQVVMTETPSVRATVRTQAMEEMLKARKQAEEAASKK